MADPYPAAIVRARAARTWRHPWVMLLFGWLMLGVVVSLVRHDWFAVWFPAACLVGLFMRREWAVVLLWLASIRDFVVAVMTLVSAMSSVEPSSIDAGMVGLGIYLLVSAVALALLVTRDAVLRWVTPER